MSKNSTISIGFKIEDQGNGLKALVVDADGLTKALRGTVSEVTGLKKSWINFATMSRAWDGIKTAVSDLQSVCGEFTAAYAVQVETETKATIRGGR